MDYEQIKLVATDVDGTLTDGGMYYTSSGETFKRFYVRDGLGVRLLRAAGVEVALISSDDSPIIEQRAKRLDITHCFAGAGDKVRVAESLCRETDLSWENLAFLGDDLQDYAVMQRVGLAAAVGDAHSLIQNVAHYVCRRPGGGGAFREFAEWLIARRGQCIETLLEG